MKSSSLYLLFSDFNHIALSLHSDDLFGWTESLRDDPQGLETCQDTKVASPANRRKLSRVSSNICRFGKTSSFDRQLHILISSLWPRRFRRFFPFNFLSLISKPFRFSTSPSAAVLTQLLFNRCQLQAFEIVTERFDEKSRGFQRIVTPCHLTGKITTLILGGVSLPFGGIFCHFHSISWEKSPMVSIWSLQRVLTTSWTSYPISSRVFWTIRR